MHGWVWWQGWVREHVGGWQWVPKYMVDSTGTHGDIKHVETSGAWGAHGDVCKCGSSFWQWNHTNTMIRRHTLKGLTWASSMVSIRDVHSRPKSHPNHGANTADLSSRDNTKTRRIWAQFEMGFGFGICAVGPLKLRFGPEFGRLGQIWFTIWVRDLSHNLRGIWATVNVPIEDVGRKVV